MARSKNGKMHICFALFPILGLAACAVGPDFKTPKLSEQARVSPTSTPEKLASVANTVGGTEQFFVQGKQVPAQWWTLFASNDLNTIVQTALQKNPGLQGADAALRAAQSTFQAQSGVLYPSIGVNAGANRQQVPPAYFGQTAGNPSLYTLYNANVSVGYKVDLFGSSRRLIESAQAQAEYQQFQLEASYLSLTSNVVNAAIREAAQREQLEAPQTILSAQQNLAKLIDQQFVIGTVSRIDTSSQNTLVANSQSQLFNFDKNLSVTRNMLVAYTGNYPGTANIPQFRLANLKLPSELPQVIPSDLIRQRPDIRAAEAALKASNAQVGAAIANLYPQLNLTAAYGSQALTTGALFGPGTAMWSFGAGLFQPLFQGGALRAQRDAAKASYDQAAANYQSTVINAFQEVANALKALETSANVLASASSAESNARVNFNLVTQQYKLGSINYLAVLNSQTQYQQAKINLIQAQADRYTTTAALYAANGGGWWNRSGPAYIGQNTSTNVSQANTPVEQLEVK
jgi:NodT family efflux transporter outer membrane factor (OMF) lipoprotein